MNEANNNRQLTSIETECAKGHSEQRLVSCQFTLLNGNICGRPAEWKWSHFRKTKLIETHYCKEHGGSMRDEGKCADDGTWQLLAANSEVRHSHPEPKA